MWVISIALCVCVMGGLDAKIRYKGYHIVNIDPKNDPSAILDLSKVRDKYELSRKVLFVDDILTPNRNLTAMVSGKIFDEFMDTVQQLGFEATGQDYAFPAFYDMLERFNNDQARRFWTLGAKEMLGPNHFMDYDTINLWAKNFTDHHGDHTRWFSLGKSHEGRDIMAFSINEERTDLPLVWVDAGSDSRFHIASHVTYLFLHILLENKHNRNHGKWMCENFRWLIVPMVNPDGHEHSFKNNRASRKSRQPYGDKCTGADIRRNWGEFFGGVGTSPEPCSERYPGPEPFSEPETRVVRDAILERAADIAAYFSLNYWTETIYFPYAGRTDEAPDNQDVLRDMAHQASLRTAKEEINYPNVEFNYGTYPERLYPMSGLSMDWVSRHTPVRYIYDIGLKPATEPGEAKPGDLHWMTNANQIYWTGPEAFSAMYHLLDQLKEIEGLEKFDVKAEPFGAPREETVLIGGKPDNKEKKEEL